MTQRTDNCKTKNKETTLYFGGVFFLLLMVMVVLFVMPAVLGPQVYDAEQVSNQVSTASLASVSSSTASSSEIVVTHLKTPAHVRSLYMTACYGGSKTLRETIVKIAEETEINAIVINIKDETGTVSIKTKNPRFQEAYDLAGCRVPDMKEFVAELHKKNIYTIARIAVFQDPFLVKHHPDWAVKRASDGGVWKDRKGISWLEVKATPVWDYTAELAKEAYDIGFDEINFDYVRFPSDGNMNDIAYAHYRPAEQTKAQALRSFYAGLKQRLKQLGVEAPTSVDLFGMTTTNKDDLGIGQTLEDALPYFDYVAPMVYPSHWPAGWNGYAKPATVPYEVIKISMGSAVDKAIAASSTPSKLRPWIQDFNLGADYTASMIRAQIQASYDVGLDSWMVWSPSNKYTAGAYLPN